KPIALRRKIFASARFGPRRLAEREQVESLLSRYILNTNRYLCVDEVLRRRHKIFNQAHNSYQLPHYGAADAHCIEEKIIKIVPPLFQCYQIFEIAHLIYIEL